MVFDRTCGGLTAAWWTGQWLYRGLGRLDASRGVTTWAEALDWLTEVAPGRAIGEIQYWGHGNWGSIRVAEETLTAASLLPGAPHHARLSALRARLAPDAFFWFRTCETFGTATGHDFARRWTRFFGRRAAGHTYVIGPLQSGLHTLGPGAEPYWSADEGVQPGETVARTSHLGAPNTITCFHGRIPDGY